MYYISAQFRKRNRIAQPAGRSHFSLTDYVTISKEILIVSYLSAKEEQQKSHTQGTGSAHPRTVQGTRGLS